MKTGNTYSPGEGRVPGRVASMEPGHEDREYILRAQEGYRDGLPQWSPVMKTGNTGLAGLHPHPHPRSLNGARS